MGYNKYDQLGWSRYNHLRWPPNHASRLKRAIPTTSSQLQRKFNGGDCKMSYPSKIMVNAKIVAVALFAIVGPIACAIAADPVPDQQSDSNSDTVRQVAQIDQMIAEVWEAYEIKPSKPATDSEWCRRVYLDVIGRIPTADEAAAFVTDKSEDKKQTLIDTLLNDDLYTEEFARNWTTVWTNLLIGRTGGTENRSMINRQGMQKFLRDSFARNKPYDKFVHELISATGSTAPGAKDFNGATNFLIDKVNEEKGSLATAATTKLFLGLQVQCTQCHNHPFNDWKQQKYWEMNAFFRQTRAYGQGMQSGMGNVATLVDQDFAGENGNNFDEAEVYYELRNGLVAVAYPVFVDGTSINRSGYVKATNRRKELADLTVRSPYFAKSIVNRMWAHFLGYGFTSPPDDLGPHNIPTHPALLDYLGQEFQSSQHDFRQLIKWIALSKPYSLSSRRNRSNVSDDPLLGEPPKFSHFYLRQMQAEQLYESLLVATQGNNQRSGGYAQQEQAKNEWLQQFTRAFGTDEGGEATSFNGTIPQVLMMFNGELIRSATSTDKGSLIDQIMRAPISQSDKVELLFMKGLARKPRPAELKLAKSLVNVNGGNLAEGLRDLWWVILNTNEFIFVH